MSSLSRFPRLALACVLAALAAGGLLALLNATELPAAAGPAPSAGLAPTEFPPAGRECFESDGHIVVVIEGEPIPIALSGLSSIARGAPYPGRDGRETVDTELVALDMVGNLPDGTPVTLTLQATPTSTGTVVELDPGTGFPADSFFDIWIEIDLGGPVEAVFNPVPLHVQAEINSIPPISQTYDATDVVVPLLQVTTGAYVGDVTEFGFHLMAPRECWFWKAGGWTDYAPSGVPDFDQKQDRWGAAGFWTYCGPVAAANSLWWLDSKLEPDPAPPTVDSDHFPLVWPYGPWDDHWVSNTMPLVDELALFFLTDPTVGTEVHIMEAGIKEYLGLKGLTEDFTVELMPLPTFEWVTEEVTRSEDVILLLGFWECLEPSENECFEWARVGGHFVTVAGVDPIGRFIAFSDPYFDRAELGGAGRVLSGTLVPHTSAALPHPPEVHNDAGNVSHDIYRIVETFSPGGTWGPEDYVNSPDDIENFVGQNFPEELVPWAAEPRGNPIVVEVEYALATSPVPPMPTIMKETQERDIAWGGVITYNITYGNDGGITGLDATIVDTLPAGVTYLDSTPGGVHAGGVVTWTFPTLAPHSSTPLTVTAEVSFGLPLGALLTNTVYLYLGSGEWDWDDVTSYITGTQVLLPVVLRDSTGS